MSLKFAFAQLLLATFWLLLQPCVFFLLQQLGDVVLLVLSLFSFAPAFLHALRLLSGERQHLVKGAVFLPLLRVFSILALWQSLLRGQLQEQEEQLLLPIHPLQVLEFLEQQARLVHEQQAVVGEEAAKRFLLIQF